MINQPPAFSPTIKRRRRSIPMMLRFERAAARVIEGTVYAILLVIGAALAWYLSSQLVEIVFDLTDLG